MATVLVADDTALLRLTLEKILSRYGHTVVAEAEDGQEAVEQYNRHRPDIVILDIAMPGVDGMEALRSIKDVNPEADVIMCSALGQKHLVMESIALGAKDYILKPVSEARIREAIDFVMGTRKSAKRIL